MLEGRARSGKAAAEAMTPEQRKARSIAGVEAKKLKANMLKATHRGEIKIGGVAISCAVLSDGTRVISENAINSQLGSSGGKSIKLKNSTISEHGPLPLFIASKALHPFIGGVFSDVDLQPITYIDNGKEMVGYSASIFPKVCEVWLKARDAKALQASQLPKAEKAEILMRGLAHIGITALVDEATGFQAEREKDALAKILEAFVAKELQPWLKTFPDEFYRQLFRLYKVSYPPEKANFKPQYFGKITNNVVYSRLAPEILPELKKAASAAAKKARLHQFLTVEIGHPKLSNHIASLITLMKLSKEPKDFYDMVDQIHPAFGDTIPMDFNG
jgi:hypothetical protein